MKAILCSQYCGPDDLVLTEVADPVAGPGEAVIAITTWPASATGSGRSASTRSSGPQYCEQRMAFMDTPDFGTHKGRLYGFMPDLKPGYNLIRARCALQIKE